MVHDSGRKHRSRHALTFDFALGPNQGQGVPSEPETPGLVFELVYGSTTVQAGESFNHTLPAPILHFNYDAQAIFINTPLLFDNSTLVAVVAAELVSNLSGGGVLKESSVVDLTSQVTDGSLSWVAPADAESYELTVLGNGSFMVDHFSDLGAKKLTEFWDQNLLDDVKSERRWQRLEVTCNQDYRTTLNEGYQEYLSQLLT
ncbi:hypothetical protein GQ53DRAFT_764142 [Thozetella sp. PMI_491]|nr:hypothetical protein GQ53DRAFT_764142 [Thozetella sp. PMI_491]